MYLHLGSDMIVPKRSVVAIFDLDNATSMPRTRDFLRRAEKENRVITVGDELPKSFVICTEAFGDIVYISPISSATLLKRCRQKRLGF